MPVKSDTIVTHSGKLLSLRDPSPDAIYLNDIAWSLANRPRWNGHTSRFFSVAEHSVLCSALAWRFDCDPLASLLHDAAEAYTADIPSPHRQHVRRYNRLQSRLQQLIFTKYMGTNPRVIYKAVDDVLLTVEGYALMPPALWNLLPLAQATAVVLSLQDQLHCWSPLVAYRQFLSRCHKLHLEDR
jgi:hypothetical protein